jgi:hypothetical protein
MLGLHHNHETDGVVPGERLQLFAPLADDEAVHLAVLRCLDVPLRSTLPPTQGFLDQLARVEVKEVHKGNAVLVDAPPIHAAQ